MGGLGSTSMAYLVRHWDTTTIDVNQLTGTGLNNMLTVAPGVKTIVVRGDHQRYWGNGLQAAPWNNHRSRIRRSYS